MEYRKKDKWYEDPKKFIGRLTYQMWFIFQLGPFVVNWYSSNCIPLVKKFSFVDTTSTDESFSIWNVQHSFDDTIFDI